MQFDQLDHFLEVGSKLTVELLGLSTAWSSSLQRSGPLGPNVATMGVAPRLQCTRHRLHVASAVVGAAQEVEDGAVVPEVVA